MPSALPRKLLAAVLVTACLTTACAEDVKESPLAGSTAGTPVGGDPDGDLGGELDQRIEPDTGLSDDDEAPSANTVVQAALADVEAFWARGYEDIYGEPYEPISGGFFPYGPDTEVPPCGRPRPSYDEIAANAFYCPSSDLIAWDEVNLVPAMYQEFGGFTLGIVFAHEFGHAVQARADLLDNDTILTELQADCFAGAWTADVEDGGSDFFAVTLDALDRTVAGFLSLRDGVGTSAQDPAAHGTGFDRIGAFSDGYEHGLEQCARYPDMYETGELVIVEVPFTSQDDFERGGNLPLDELLPAVIRDLEDFWTVIFDESGFDPWEPVADVIGIDPDVDEVSCGDVDLEGDQLINASFYCVPDNTIYIDIANLVPALNEIGDYAVGTELARQYALAAQVQQGNLEDSLTSNLQVDCYAGVYAASGFLGNRENQELVLSPGDLDEAVIAILLRSDDATGDEADLSVGTAFQRFDAYRSGFMEGIESCEALVD